MNEAFLHHPGPASGPNKYGSSNPRRAWREAAKTGWSPAASKKSSKEPSTALVRPVIRSLIPEIGKHVGWLTWDKVKVIKQHTHTYIYILYTMYTYNLYKVMCIYIYDIYIYDIYSCIIYMKTSYWNCCNYHLKVKSNSVWVTVPI